MYRAYHKSYGTQTQKEKPSTSAPTTTRSCHLSHQPHFSLRVLCAAYDTSTAPPFLYQAKKGDYDLMAARKFE